MIIESPVPPSSDGLPVSCQPLSLLPGLSLAGLAQVPRPGGVAEPGGRTAPAARLSTNPRVRGKFNAAGARGPLHRSAARFPAPESSLSQAWHGPRHDALSSDESEATTGFQSDSH